MFLYFPRRTGTDWISCRDVNCSGKNIVQKHLCRTWVIHRTSASVLARRLSKAQSFFLPNYLFIKEFETERISIVQVVKGRRSMDLAWRSAEAEPSNHFIDKLPLQTRYFLMI